MIGAAAFVRYAKQKSYHLFTISIRDINKALEEKKYPDPATILPEEYHDFLDIFSQEDLNKLAPY